MAGDLVQAATILAGSGVGAWIADKLLGPSADALGEQLRLYAGDRLAKIFGRTKEITAGKEIQPLPPGFALIVFQRASISEDHPLLTEMWAQLIASAAQKQTNRHVIYADILTQIGGEEALLLEKFGRVDGDHFQLRQQHAIGQFRSQLDESEIVFGYGKEDAAEKLDKILALESGVSGIISRAEIATKEDGQLFSISRRMVNAVSIDILERQRVIESIVVQGQHAQGPKVYFSVLTELGADLLRACRSNGLS